MKKIFEAPTNYTPLQQDNDPGIDDLMSIDNQPESTNVRLSQLQKFVLTKLMLPNTTDLIAYEQTSGGRNVVANRETLEKLGMVEVSPNSAAITEKGTEALKQEGLVDEMGNLTPHGEQYAYAKDLAAVGEIAASQKNQLQTPDISPSQSNEPPQAKPMGNTAPLQPDTGTPSLESWSMISEMQHELYEKEFISNFSK